MIGSVELCGYVGGYDFDDAWFGKLAAVANDPNVEVLLAVGSGQTAFAGWDRRSAFLAVWDSTFEPCQMFQKVGDGKVCLVRYAAWGINQRI